MALSHKQNILQYIGVPIQVKNKLKKKLSPFPCEAGDRSSPGSRRPGHPHSTPCTVANPARGLLNREKRAKEKVWQRNLPRAAR